MKDIIKLTNEYASNLNCLFMNFSDSDASYHEIFKFLFHTCVPSEDVNVSDENFFSTIDIVFIKVDDRFASNSENDLKEFIQSLRKENELLPVYMIEDKITSPQAQDNLHKCFCSDGSFPTPFDRENVYRFMYRILKRITDKKDLEAYILSLENQLFDAPMQENTSETKKIPRTNDRRIATENTTRVNDRRISNERRKDIRATHTEKVSASEFSESLDDTVIDKIEIFQENLDELVGVLYDIESANSEESLQLLIPVNNHIQDISDLMDSLIVFPIIARSFESLHQYISNLSEVEFTQEENKAMFVAILVGMIHDLEKWLDVVFVAHTTEDIHYLDSSFSSNILELETLFVETDEDDDDDDLEFF